MSLQRMKQRPSNRALVALGAILAIVLVGCSSLLTDLQEPDPLALRTVLADLLPPLSDVDFSISRITAALGLAGATINGATVVWESSNPSVIASDGTIVRPPAGSDPIKVSVKAKVKWGTVTKEKVFEVTVAPMPAALADQVAEDRDAIQALPAGSTADTLVEGNLKLPTVGACGSTIAWVSSDTSLIANDGSVTRAAFGSADGTVTLTATITKDGQTSTKTIQVKVKAARPTASQAVDTDVAALAVSSLGTDTDLAQIKTSLLLPTSGVSGSTITWTSSDPTVIVAAGTVTRPASGSGSKAITLTAAVTSGTTTTTKTFNVTVLEVPATAAASVSEDKANLIGTTIKGTNPDLSSVSSDLHLPGTGSSGTVITWESSDPTLVSATGAVTQPSSDSGDKPATLTATITKDGVTETTTITVTVKCTTQYTVTFDSQSATTAATPTTVLVAPPATTIAALPTDPARTDYDFGGWWTGTAGTGYRFRTSTAVAANITAYAKWTPTGGGGAATGTGGGGTTSTTYTVTFDSQSATTSASPATVTVTSPAATTVSALPTAPARTGYTFGGWFTAVNGGGSQFLVATPVSANITVYAMWTATGGGGTTTYAITYNLDSGINSGSNPATYDVTTATITLAAPTRTGYSFGGWYTEVGLTNVATTLPLG
ncbi:MAG: InlB B-repeat-containing protein, partial [Spirochaetota bacterium]